MVDEINELLKICEEEENEKKSSNIVGSEKQWPNGQNDNLPPKPMWLEDADLGDYDFEGTGMLEKDIRESSEDDVLKMGIDDDNYDRRAVEQKYGLEDGELDGVSIRDAEDMVEEEEGALDRFIFQDDEIIVTDSSGNVLERFIEQDKFSGYTNDDIVEEILDKYYHDGSGDDNIIIKRVSYDEENIPSNTEILYELGDWDYGWQDESLKESTEQTYNLVQDNGDINIDILGSNAGKLELNDVSLTDINNAWRKLGHSKPLSYEQFSELSSTNYDSIIALIYKQRHKKDESLKESKLNEGAGAGYTVEGEIYELKVDHINETVIEDGKTAFGTDVKFATIKLDATAKFDGTATDYYGNGAELESANIKITELKVNPNLLYHLDKEEFDYGTITADNLNDMFGHSTIKFKSDVIGAGWTHTPFNGHVESNRVDDDYPPDIDGITFDFTDKYDIDEIEKGLLAEEDDVEITEDDVYNALENSYKGSEFGTLSLQNIITTTAKYLNLNPETYPKIKDVSKNVYDEINSGTNESLNNDRDLADKTANESHIRKHTKRAFERLRNNKAKVFKEAFDIDISTSDISQEQLEKEAVQSQSPDFNDAVNFMAKKNKIRDKKIAKDFENVGKKDFDIRKVGRYELDESLFVPIHKVRVRK